MDEMRQARCVGRGAELPRPVWVRPSSQYPPYVDSFTTLGAL